MDTNHREIMKIKKEKDKTELDSITDELRALAERVAFVNSDYSLDKYQEDASDVATWAPGGSKPLAYYALKLNGEAGEVAELVGKAWRGDYTQKDDSGFLQGYVDPTLAIISMNKELRDKLIKELGDVLWYVQHMADKIGAPLSQIAEANISKLRARVENVKNGLPAKSGDGA